MGLISMEMCESLAANNQTTHKKYKNIIKFTEILGQVSLKMISKCHCTCKRVAFTLVWPRLVV
jgi:hypothetical protein